VPIDYFMLCEDCHESGPAVWRQLSADDVRWFLTEHGGHRVVVVSEHDDRVFDWERWVNDHSDVG
jgi:hypothetical protein